MIYRIRYYDENDRELGAVSRDRGLEDVKRVALDGLIRHQAKVAKIFDEDDGFREVWSSDA